MKEEGTKTPTEREGAKGEEGEGPAIEDASGQREQGAVYNTVQCCSAPLSGMEGRTRDKELLSQRSRPAAPEEAFFSAHMVMAALQDAPLDAAACSASGHTRSTVSAR